MKSHIALILCVLTLLWLTSCANSLQDSSLMQSESMASDTVQVVSPGVISTGLYERDFALSHDGQHALFTRGNFDHTIRLIVQVTYKEGRWSDPTLVPFSGEYNDIEPFYHPSKPMVYFASDRPLPGETEVGDYNIWQVQIQPDQLFGDPTPLDTIINTSADEFYPAVTHDNTLYFTATYKDKGTGTEDIYRSEWQNGGYQEPVALDSNINSPTYEFNAYISPTEDTLVFSSYGRPDGMGGGDLYISIRGDSGWSPAENLGPSVNSDRLDYCPFIDFKTGVLYFTSNRKTQVSRSWDNLATFEEVSHRIGNGMGDIYWIRF